MCVGPSNAEGCIFNNVCSLYVENSVSYKSQMHIEFSRKNKACTSDHLLCQHLIKIKQLNFKPSQRAKLLSDIMKILEI